MTNEQKQLLLKDLCGRLPYGIKGLHRGEVHSITIIDANGSYPSLQVDGYDAWFPIETFKPYLRSMSSITEEEKEEIKPLFSEFTDEFGKRVLVVRQNKMVLYQDWLNSHHFDYRGFIEKGLALEALEDMYKTE